MNKKTLAILALFVVAAGATAVSAFELPGMSTAEDQNVTIDGIDFNIPAGFTEDADLALNGVENETAGLKYVTWGKTYTNDTNEVISIGVATYDGVEIDDEMPSYIGSDKKTINGVVGYEYDVAPFDGFTYAKNGKLVIITVTDDSLLGDVIVK